MKRKWIVRFLLLLITLVLLSPCLICFWGAWAGYALFDYQQHSRVYPGATSVAYTYDLVVNDSILKQIYYWTPDAVEQVKSHYETFTLPFVDNVTIYQPRGGDFKLGSFDTLVRFRTPEEVLAIEAAFVANRSCSYSQILTCVQIRLMAIGDESLDIATLIPHYPTGATPVPSAILNRGTLIIHSYHTEGDLNLFDNWYIPPN